MKAPGPIAMTASMILSRAGFPTVCSVVVIGAGMTIIPHWTAAASEPSSSGFSLMSRTTPWLASHFQPSAVGWPPRQIPGSTCAKFGMPWLTVLTVLHEHPKQTRAMKASRFIGQEVATSLGRWPF